MDNYLERFDELKQEVYKYRRRFMVWAGAMLVFWLSMALVLIFYPDNHKLFSACGFCLVLTAIAAFMNSRKSFARIRAIHHLNDELVDKMVDDFHKSITGESKPD